MKHQKLLSGLILTGLLVLVCLTGSAAAANVSVSPGLVHYSENFTLYVDYDAGTNYQWYYSDDGGTTWYQMAGGTSMEYTTQAQYEGIIPWPPFGCLFKVEYLDAGGVLQSAESTSPLYILNDTRAELSTDYAFLGDTITLYLPDVAGQDSITWYASRDGYDYEVIGSGNMLDYVVSTSGTYTFKADIAYSSAFSYHDILTSSPVTVIWPASAGPTLGHLSGQYYLYLNAPTGSNFQWYYSDDGGVSWTIMSAATTSMYSFVPKFLRMETDTTYSFKVEYTDLGETRTSYASSTLQFIPDYTVTATPDYGFYGDTITLTADTPGGDTTVTWYAYMDGDYIGTIGTGSTVTHTPTFDWDPHYYTYMAEIRNTTYSFLDHIETNPIKMVPGPHAGSGVGFMGDTYSIWIDPVGSEATFTYQWHYSTDDGTTWTPISGAMQPGMTFIPAEQDWVEPYPTTYKFKVTFTDEGATRTGYAPETVFFLEDIVITISPDHGSVGEELTISVDAPGADSYDWAGYRDGDYIGPFGTSDTFTYTPNRPGVYSWLVDIGYTTPEPLGTQVMSDNVTIREAATISATDGLVSDTFTLTGPSGGTNYQWYAFTDLIGDGRGVWLPMSGATTERHTFVPKDDELISATYPPAYHKFKVVYTYDGKEYTAIARNLTASTDEIHFYADPTVTVSELYGSVGDTVTATASAPNVTYISWNLYKDGVRYKTLPSDVTEVSNLMTEPGTYQFRGTFIYWPSYSMRYVNSPDILIREGATITPASGSFSDTFTLTGPDGGTNYQWYYSTHGGADWITMPGATSRVYTFKPEDEEWSSSYPEVFNFRVVYTYNSHTISAIVPDSVSFFDILEPYASPSGLILGGDIELVVNNTGYTSVLWEVSKNGGEWIEADTGQFASYTPAEAGTYRFRVTATYPGGFTQTANVDGSVKVVDPTILITPKRGNLTTELTLKVKNTLDGYTDFLWSVSADGGVNWEVIGDTNPYSYVPGEEGEYLYKVVMSGEDLDDYTIETEDPVEIKDGTFSDSAPISTAAFYGAAVFLILLFMGGLYFVYNDNIFGFIASGFAVLCSWALMMLSAFGHVGDTHVFWDDATGATVTQVLFIDPSMVYISIFACIIMTVVYIVILARFVAQLALLRARDPEEEEEEVQ